MSRKQKTIIATLLALIAAVGTVRALGAKKSEVASASTTQDINQPANGGTKPLENENPFQPAQSIVRSADGRKTEAEAPFSENMSEDQIAASIRRRLEAMRDETESVSPPQPVNPIWPASGPSGQESSRLRDEIEKASSGAVPSDGPRQSQNVAELKDAEVKDDEIKPQPSGPGESAETRVKQLEEERVRLIYTLKQRADENEQLKKENISLSRQGQQSDAVARRESIQENARLTVDLSAANRELTAAREELERLRSDKNNALEKIKSLDSKVAALEAAARERDKLSNEKEILHGKLEAEGSAKADLIKDIEKKDEQLRASAEATEAARIKLDEFSSLTAEQQKKIAELEARVIEHEKLRESVQAMEVELLNAKNELVLAYTEIDALSKQGGRAKSRTMSQQETEISRQPVQAATRQSSPIPPPATSAQDVLVLEVAVEKAHLRSGPGEEHSPVMQAGAGTLLTAEAKQGDWYRVITPTGTRAYIRGDVVQLPGSGTIRRPALTRTIKRAENDTVKDLPVVEGDIDAPKKKPKGFTEIEDEALERLRNELLRKRSVE